MNKTNKNDLAGYFFIRNNIVHAGITPSLRKIGKAVGYASPRSVQLMLERLQKRGLLSYSEGKIKLIQKKTPMMSEKTIHINLIGNVACGLPSFAEQNTEATFKISTKIARPGYKYFILRAEGTSMNKSDINDGDLVLVREQSAADDGEKVVALIDDEATIKHIYHEDEAIVLKPNSTYKSHRPIILSDEFMIQGVVVATLPKNIY